MQPFLLVILADASERILNENHVVSIERATGSDHAIITLSTGEILTISHPPYDDWLNDVLIRKS